MRLPEGYRSEHVREQLASELEQIPAWMRLSLTWDRGREMAEHQELAAASGATVYFCDPRSPWQRGTNENTNRLLRQYLGKGADLRSLTQHDLDTIAMRINDRPRRVLDWDSATDRYQRLIRDRYLADCLSGGLLVGTTSASGGGGDGP